MVALEYDAAWRLTDTVTKLRRVLRSSIRKDFPWERLPMAQVELMQGLAETPGAGIRELAAHHRLAPNTVSNLVQQMVVAGLVERRPADSDRRAVAVDLSALGHARLEAWLEAHRVRLASGLDALDAADRAAIDAALPALARFVDVLERNS